MSDFINNLDKNYVIAGGAISIIILLAYAILYNFYLIELVKEGNEFFGSFYLFAGLIIIPLLISISVKNLSLLIGNVLGVLLYFFIILPVSVLLVGG